MKRAARWTAYGVSAIVVTLLAAALILPEFLDSTTVEADLQRSLSQAVGGEIKWEKLQIRLLPTPRGVLKRLEFEVAGTHASAEQVDASLALLPLLRGRAEIVSLKLAKPDVRVELAPEKRSSASKEDAGEIYRRVMGEVVRALREFAPDTVVEIRNGDVDIRSPGARPIVLRQLSAQARSSAEGVKIELETASDYWQKLRLSASVAQADLSASANLEVAGIKLPGASLPAASLRAKARTDAIGSFELTLEEARRGATTIGPGEVRYSFKGDALAANVVVDIDVAQAVASARAAALPLGGVDSATGRLAAKVSATARGAEWQAKLQIVNSDASLLGWQLPAPVTISAGSMTIDARKMRFDQVALALAGSQATVSATLAGYRTSNLTVDANATIDLDLAEGFKAAGPLAVQAGIESATGHLAAEATAASRGADWQAALRIVKSDASVQGWRLPAALGLSGGSAMIDAKRIKVDQAALSAGEGRAVISGTVADYASQPVVEARIDSPGIIVDALIPKATEAKKEEKSAWPLPVTGRVALRSDFIRYQRRNFAPVSAMLTMQSDSARLEVKEAALCGIAVPLSVEAREEGLSVATLITAQRQQITEAARCLSDEHVQMTGEFDLRAELSAKGKAPELVRNLEGTLTAEARNGELAKFALIGNIMAGAGLPALEGLTYRTIAARGRFGGGRFLLDEASLRSPVMGLAGNGWISLGDYQSRLTVLVAPLARLDRVVRGVPVFGTIVGGAVTSIPVGVSGDIRDPRVIPLGPGAITSEVKGIFERTLKLPALLDDTVRKQP